MAMQNTDREARLKRALAHAVYKDHDLIDPEADKPCAGCLEVQGFLAVPGYQGNLEYPLMRIAEEAR